MGWGTLFQKWTFRKNALKLWRWQKLFSRGLKIGNPLQKSMIVKNMNENVILSKKDIETWISKYLLCQSKLGNFFFQTWNVWNEFCLIWKIGFCNRDLVTNGQNNLLNYFIECRIDLKMITQKIQLKSPLKGEYIICKKQFDWQNKFSSNLRFFQNLEIFLKVFTIKKYLQNRMHQKKETLIFSSRVFLLHLGLSSSLVLIRLLPLGQGHGAHGRLPLDASRWSTRWSRNLLNGVVIMKL